MTLLTISCEIFQRTYIKLQFHFATKKWRPNFMCIKTHFKINSNFFKFSLYWRQEKKPLIVGKPAFFYIFDKNRLIQFVIDKQQCRILTKTYHTSFYQDDSSFNVEIKSCRISVKRTFQFSRHYLNLTIWFCAKVVGMGKTDHWPPQSSCLSLYNSTY